jgi:putative transposase
VATHSPVVPDVVARLGKTYQAFFRRVQRGEKAGFFGSQSHERSHSVTYKELGEFGEFGAGAT